MSKALPRDQGVEVKVWLHPNDHLTLHMATLRGEGTMSGLVRECVGLCIHFGLRPWRALQARHRAESALRALDELEDIIRGGQAGDRDALDVVSCIRADLRAAYLPDGECPDHRLVAPPEAGPGKG